MKKYIYSFTIFSLLSFAFLPAMATVSVTTGLTQVQSGGTNPVVKAKWEMYGKVEASGTRLGEDDSSADGAQFYPTGIKDDSRTITICAIVTDGDGMGDIAGVYADVYYPTDPTQNDSAIDFGPSHTPLSTQSGSNCAQFMQQDTLKELPLSEGYDLICNNIQSNNPNLPTWNQGYGYSEVCGVAGELMKLDAKVYCVDKDISYEDPSGDYKVVVQAQDGNSLNGTLENTFEYLPLTAFQADFNQVNYGNVKLNINKIAKGDITWDETINSGLPSVRNVGNTRMNLQVIQNDMGLGMSSGKWNVMYDARVGSLVDHQVYSPNELITLQDTLDLSELDEVDFSILVNKFPSSQTTSWTGSMTLSAVAAPHLLCVD